MNGYYLLVGQPVTFLLCALRGSTGSTGCTPYWVAFSVSCSSGLSVMMLGMDDLRGGGSMLVCSFGGGLWGGGFGGFWGFGSFVQFLEGSQIIPSHQKGASVQTPLLLPPRSAFIPHPPPLRAPSGHKLLSLSTTPTSFPLHLLLSLVPPFPFPFQYGLYGRYRLVI